MAKKVVAHKKYVNGQEAPRNNLELPFKSSKDFSVGDNVVVKSKCSERKHIADEAPIKKLIGQEISNRRHPKKNAPSVVARLMGVDMLPSDMKPAIKQAEKKHESRATAFINEHFAKNDSVGHLSHNSKSAKHKKSVSFDSIAENIPDWWSYDKVGNKPRRREHPQEEELQKFKEEFEVWLAESMKKCSKAIEFGKTPSQRLARENLSKKKMVLHSHSTSMKKNMKPLETNSHERDGLRNMTLNNTYSSAQHNESFYLKKRNENVNIKLPFLQDSNHLAEVSFAPSKIVILRPGPDRFGTYEECLSSPGTSRENSSIEDFLEEVKERLKCEMMGKTCKKRTTARRGATQASYNENPSDPKKIAQRIAKHVRESVTSDLGMNLFRSESTRSYRSELHVNGANAPEFISRDTRRFLVERLRNVLKDETQHVPVVHGGKRSSMSPYQRNRTQKSVDVSNSKNKLGHLDCFENVSDIQSRSFRREDNGEEEIHEESSPRNLIRSLSAPVSGTSFGKLLLEDRHILTGAHIRRKHEAIAKGTVNMKKQKKEKFNLKEKVTSLKQSFTLKGKLFGRKFHSAEEEHGNAHDIMKDSHNRSSMMMSFYDQPENSTEVPPSPASGCSSIHEESWQPAEYLNPTISDVSSIDDSLNLNVFREIHSNIKELQRQLDELDTDVSEDAKLDEQPIETDLPEIEDQAKAYIRDLLIVSGLYDGSFHQSSSRCDPIGKLISIRVFEELEESCRHRNSDDQGSVHDQSEKLNHKMLFDLLNEVLPSILGPPKSMSKYTRNATSSMVQLPPHGKKLLDQLWQIIGVYVCPTTEKGHFSLDAMVARDLKSSPWSGLMDDDVNALGKDIECQITGDLIGEMVKDMLFRRSSRRVG